MKLPGFRFFFFSSRCQNEFCKEKATHRFEGYMFCKDHYDVLYKAVKQTLRWIQEEDEKYERDPKAFDLR